MDALPVSKSVINNIESSIRISKNNDWHSWNIEPNINGTIIIRRDNAAISLGATSFSYYFKVGINIGGQNQITFSPDAIIATIRFINEQCG